MSEQNSAASASVNRAKPYQLMLFPLNNGATNVYYVLETGTIKMEGEATELANNIEVRKAYLGCE